MFSKNKVELHVKQFEFSSPLHVKHEVSQLLHTLGEVDASDLYFFFILNVKVIKIIYKKHLFEGQLFTQLLLSKYVGELQEVQFILVAKHVKHLELQSKQFPPLLYYPVGQSLLLNYLFILLIIVFYLKNIITSNMIYNLYLQYSLNLIQ